MNYQLPPTLSNYLNRVPVVAKPKTNGAGEMSNEKEEGFLDKLWNYDLFGEIFGEKRKPPTRRAAESATPGNQGAAITGAGTNTAAGAGSNQSGIQTGNGAGAGSAEAQGATEG